MDILTIINSAPVGVLLGIIVTKTFDILNKKVEYKQETKKIRYSKKLEIGETAIQFLQTYYGTLRSINLTINEILQNETLNQKFFNDTWKREHKKLEEIENSTMEMFGKAFMYYNIEVEDFHLFDKDNELLRNVSDLLNLSDSEEPEVKRATLVKYNSSLERLMNKYNELIKLIIKESKK